MKEQNSENSWPFKTLYTCEGKDYVKYDTSSGSETTFHVKYPSAIEKLLQDARRGAPVIGAGGSSNRT